jgi:DNA-binding transcriptional MocR family regulator
MTKKIQRSYIREILDATNEDTISFAGGLPDENLFPMEKLKKATLKVFENSLCMQYSKSKGLDSLREKIAFLYTNYFDFPTTKDEIMITTGSQQAFDLISKTFLQKDILVQTPTYIGALSSFKVLGLKIKGFKNISSLTNMLSKKSGLYCMSDLSNPNAISLNTFQRKELSDILNKKGSFLIEDAAYSLLNFSGKINKPISVTYENSFHLGSFSKIVAPGLRVGWIRANKDLLDKALIAKEALDLHTSTFNQMILNQFLEDNDIFEHIKQIRREYKVKMEFMAKCFKKYIPSFDFKKPEGGMFIYGKFNEDSFPLAKRVLEKNIAFVPAKVFFDDNQNSYEARFNFTNSTKEQIEKGIKEISNTLQLESKSIWFEIFKKNSPFV